MKILLVEDDRKLSRFLSLAFTEQGYVIDVCLTGAEATMLAQGAWYDLMVLDRMLSDTDGVTLCRGLREQGLRVPILMLSARDAVEDKVSALDAGADDYITKPFHLNELLARVRSLIRRTSMPAQMVLQADLLTVDFRQHIAKVDGEEINLTSREFALLALLVRNVGRVVTRTEILEQVWSTHANPGSNIISVHVRHLREKLGRAADYLETVRGRGFRLAPKKTS